MRTLKTNYDLKLGGGSVNASRLRVLLFCAMLCSACSAQPTTIRQAAEHSAVAEVLAPSQSDAHILAASQREKHLRIARTLTAVQDLERIASTNRSTSSSLEVDAATRERIIETLARIKELDQIGTLARICWAVVGSGTAGDESYDSVFDMAFWNCVERLALDTSPQGEIELAWLGQSLGLDAGNSLLFREYVRLQQERRKRAGNT
jgi:hypothetical protein